LSVMPNIVLPLDWVKTLFSENGANFYADSASFFVKDPMQLNKFKASMQKFVLFPVNPQADEKAYGYALAVNDETFIRAAKSINDNLRLLRLFMPLLIIVTLLVGFVISYVMMQSRRSEFAVMRMLGMKMVSCLVIYLIENASISMVGALIGSVASILLTGASASAGFLAAAIFWAAYMLGVMASVLSLRRVSVITMLTKTD